VHIVAKDSQLIIKDSTAMESVSNLGRMSKFLATMIARAADDNPSAEFKRNSTHADSTDNDTSHSRIVQGQYITAKAAADIRGQLTFQQSYQLQSSPFSNIFCETSRPPNRTEGTEDIKSNISFDDAFLDESTTIKDMDVSHSYDDMDEAMPSISWTRNRIKAINSVTELAPSGTQIDKIAFTKEMLASAEVVSQVDYSFIIIKMGSLICAVDQHAADERISLEALEKALFHHDSHDAMTVSLTKRQLHVGDILKSSPVAPSKSCLLTSTQMITARHHQTLLHKWKFSFEESSTDERIIILRGLPSVCGRVAQVEDMLEFLNDLGLVGGSSTKPKFVSRVLASNACRYAIMFGDRLSVPQCEKVIESLSKCQQPYQCAHGRPSIIPLTHMSQGWANEQTAGRSNQDQADTNNNLEHYQKWGPKRVIRHQKSRTN
jgi:DNA mismatch repair ATPase MutL